MERITKNIIKRLSHKLFNINTLVMVILGCFLVYDVYFVYQRTRLEADPDRTPLLTSKRPNRPLIELITSKKKLPKVDAIKRALGLIPGDAVTLGKTEMKNHKAVFTGVTKDNAAQIEPVLKQIVETGALFADYQVLIYDMDSTDKTLDILNEFAKTQGTRWRIIRKQGESLVNLRNSFLAEFRENPLYKDYDLMVVANMNLKYGWDVRGIAHSFSKFAAWDAVSANGVYKESFGYTWTEIHALRPSNRTESDTGLIHAGWINPHMKDFETDRTGYWNWVGAQVNNVRISPNRADPLVPVDSAFGGLAVYKRATLKDCLYSSTNDDSEHVAFHACLREKSLAKIFIDVKFLVKVSNFA